MAAQQLSCPAWIKWWLVLSAIIVLWDALYIFLRPHTMPGGKLFAIWSPYAMYQGVDLIYSNARWRSGDRFAEAQAACNMVEISLQMVSLYLMGKGKQGQARGCLLAFTTQAFTFWKTVLYWLYDIMGDFAHTGHNTPFDLYVVYMVPNSLWIIGPAVVMVVLGQQIVRALPGGTKRTKQI